MVSLNKNLIRTCLFFIFVLNLGQCGSCAGLSGLTNSAGTGDASTIESLSEAETSLYADCPIDIPVTIAKVDSPDLDLVTVTITEIDGSSPIVNELRLATLTEDTDYLFTFTGAVGAVSVPTVTPYVLLSNSDNGEQATAGVSDDGSFEVAVTGQVGQRISLFSLTDSDLTVAQASPALTYTADENSVVSVMTTNSSSLVTALNVIVDNNSNAYFQTLNSDGTYNLWRRNLDGTEAELVLEGMTNLVNVINVIQDQDGTYGSLVVITDAGAMYYLALEEPTSLNKYLSFNGPGPIYSYADAVTLDEFGSIGEGTFGLFLMFALGNGEFLVQIPLITGDSSINSENQLALYSADENANAVAIIPTNDDFGFVGNDGVVTAVDLQSFDLGAFAYAFVSPAGSDGTSQYYSLYLLDLTSEAAWDPVAAWDNRATLVADMEYTVNYASVGAGVLAASATTLTTPSYDRILMWQEVSGLEVILDSETDGVTYAGPLAVSPNGKFIVACEYPALDLVVHRVGIDEPGPFQKLVHAGYCSNHPFFIDSQYRLFFYSTLDNLSTETQLSVVDLKQVPLLEGLTE